MSFAKELKKELAAVAVKNNCCKRALLAGLLLDAEVGERTLSVKFRSEEAAVLASDLLRTQYGVSPETKEVGFCGHVYQNMTFFSPAIYKLLTSFGQAGVSLERAVGFSCDACRSCFLRGAFLSHGTLNDPHKSFHLEFLFTKTSAANLFSDFLEECGYPPKKIVRAGGTGLYFKNGNAVEELSVMAGAHHVIFEIINTRIEREIRNRENRATNCVARNIGKTVGAAARQVKAIERLMQTALFEGLPEPLLETAKLRYEYPDATLEELARLHETPITKSGLNHRLEKLVLMAEELPKKEESV